MHELTEYLAKEARKYGRKNIIARPGEIVMADFGNQGILRRVKIVSVSVYLIAHFIDPAWRLEFAMTYCGQRIKKDGSVLGFKGTAVVLDNFVKEDGTTWNDDLRKNTNKTVFDHVALFWYIESSFDHKRCEYVC